MRASASSVHTPVAASLPARVVKRHRAIRAAARNYPALEAAAEAWIEFDKRTEALMEAQDTAGRHAATMGPKHGHLKAGCTGESRFHWEFDEPVHPDARRAFAEEDRADAAYERGIDRQCNLTKAILTVPATTREEAFAKQAVFAIMSGAKNVPSLPFKEDIAAAYRALTDDLRTLSKLPRPSGAPCPAAAIAVELDASMARQLQAEGSEYSARLAGDTDAQDAAAILVGSLYDEHWLLADRLAGVQATSAKGAAAQIAVAMGYADLVRGVPDQAHRDEHHSTLERLLSSVAAYMATHISEPAWQWYVGAEHPGPVIPTADADQQFVIWQQEFDRLLAASGRDHEDQETGPNWKAAMRLDVLIRRTPGAGQTAAVVKLRQLLHPEIGLVSAGEAESDEDALRTALAALEGRPPKATAVAAHGPFTAKGEDDGSAAHLIAAE